jgi:hypothetical protein
LASIFSRILNSLDRLYKSDLMEHPAPNTLRLFGRRTGNGIKDLKKNKGQSDNTEKEIQGPTQLTPAEAQTQNISDLLLDITHLNINHIKMNLEDLDAEVTVRVELTSQLHLDFSTDIKFDKVNIDLKNVEITAQIKVNLRKISQIIDRVLKSIEDNPESVSVPINGENVLSANLSLNQKVINETLESSSEKIIEGESHIKKE